MAQTIKLKNSGTSSNTPSSLEHGELAINYADGKIFYKNSSNSIVEFANLSGSFLPISGGTLTGNLSLGDNVQIQLGNQTNGDLQIYHDGFNSYIRDTGTGNLNISADQLRVLNAGNNEIKAEFTTDGSVDLYHNNALKIATTSTGISISNDANFPDNGKAIFGAGNDLQIYHNSTDNSSYIRELGSGNLKLLGDNVQILNAAGTENQIFSASDGSVYLYHNGISKFETTSTGIDVTGSVVADGLTVDGVVDANSFTDVITNTILTASGNLDIDTVLNSRDVTFTQGSNSLMTIGGTGNVNIPNGSLMVGSTTAPTVKVDIRVPTSASVVTAINLDASGNNNGDGTAINFSRASNVLSSIAKIEAVKTEVSNNETDLVFSNYAAGSLTEKMRLVGATGKAIFSGDVTVNGSTGLLASKIYAGEGTSSGTRSQLTRSGTTNRLHSFTGSTSATPFEIMMGTSHSALAIDTSSNVNIANGGLAIAKTSAPDALLDIDTGIVSASPSARFRRNHGAQAFQQLSGLSFYWNTSNGLQDNTIVYGASANSSLKFTHATGSAFHDRLTINSSGNASFSGSVTSTGQINAGTNLAAGTSVYSGNGVYYGSTTLALKNNTSGNFLSFAANANATFSGSVTSTGLTVTKTTITDIASFINNNGSIVLGHYGGGSQIDLGSNIAFRIRQGSAIPLSINSSGNVGIGTTAPAEKLHVYTTGASRVEAESTTGFAAFKATNNSGSYGWYVDNSADKFHLYDFTDNANRITLDGAGNVGIGTTAPLSETDIVSLQIGSSSVAASQLVLDDNDSNGPWKIRSNQSLIFYDNTSERLRIDSSGNATFSGNVTATSSISTTAIVDNVTAKTSSGNIAFKNNSGSEKMRLTDGGNLLIGKTADNNSDVGIRMQSTGHTSIVKSGGNCLTLNRLSTDGSLLDFRKDTGTLVGSIGTGNSGNLYIGSGDAGINFNKDVNSVYPINADTGGATNGTLDLGLSAYRFKDAHFSGTVNSGNVNVGGGTVADPTLTIDSAASGDPTLVFDTSQVNRTAIIQFKDQGALAGGFIHYKHQYDRLDFGAQSATSFQLSVVNSGVMIGATTPYRNLLVAFTSTDTNTSSSASGFGGNSNVGNGLMINNTSTANNTYAPLDFKCGTNHVWGRLAYKATDTNDAFGQFEFITMDDGSAVNALTIASGGNGTFAGSCTATSFPTSSDARLKDNIEDAKDSGDIIDKIKVRQFDWKKTGKHQDYGMIAQELILEVPDAVSTPTEDHEMMGVDYSKLVPMLVKEIQQLRARVQTLEEEK